MVTVSDSSTGTTRIVPEHLEDFPALIPADWVAKHLGVTAGTVRSMAQGGQLHSVRLGRLMRITKSSLELLLAGAPWQVRKREKK
jgi:excisionase family DNA binding protein